MGESLAEQQRPLSEVCRPDAAPQGPSILPAMRPTLSRERRLMTTATGTDQEQQDMTRNSYATADPKTLKASGCNPNQLCAEQQAQLVAEVKHQGRLLKPIVVRDDGGQLVIVDGEQNWAAALRAWSGRGTD
jgi:hypothetical protein